MSRFSDFCMQGFLLRQCDSLYLSLHDLRILVTDQNTASINKARVISTYRYNDDYKSNPYDYTMEVKIDLGTESDQTEIAWWNYGGVCYNAEAEVKELYEKTHAKNETVWKTLTNSCERTEARHGKGRPCPSVGVQDSEEEIRKPSWVISARNRGNIGKLKISSEKYLNADRLWFEMSNEQK